MDIVELTKLSKALSDPTRIRILEFLLACGGPVGVGEEGDVSLEGAAAGEVCCRLTGKDGIDSRISFHLHKLRRAGLLTIERQGRRMICTPNRDALHELGNHFLLLAHSNKDNG